MLAFGDFLGATVMVAEIDINILDLFTIELGHQAQHTMGAWMVRTEVEYHRLIINALHFLAAKEVFSIARHHFQS